MPPQYVPIQVLNHNLIKKQSCRNVRACTLMVKCNGDANMVFMALNFVFTFRLLLYCLCVFKTVVIDGTDGRIIWKVFTHRYEMSSDLVAMTTEQHQDLFIFRIQGRPELSEKSKNGSVVKVISSLKTKCMVYMLGYKEHWP